MVKCRLLLVVVVAVAGLAEAGARDTLEAKEVLREQWKAAAAAKADRLGSTMRTQNVAKGAQQKELKLQREHELKVHTKMQTQGATAAKAAAKAAVAAEADATVAAKTAEMALAPASTGEDRCAPGCPTHWINDGSCDGECFYNACDNDGDDCAGYCAPGCPFSWIDDGECDEACFNFRCAHDGEYDCLCAPGCPPNRIGDEHCDSECNNQACLFDDGDCDPPCAPGCPLSWINDGICDENCLTAGCSYDGTDCRCKTDCPFEWLGDGECDSVCSSEHWCNGDDGDCWCTDECPPSWHDDESCDFPCFDCPGEAADCVDYCAARCPTSWLNDGWCDPECQVASCDYDREDCFQAASACSVHDSKKPCRRDSDCTWAKPPGEGRACYPIDSLRALPCSDFTTKRKCQKKKGFGYCKWAGGVCFNKWDV